MAKVSVDDVLGSIESWTVLDLNNLVKGIEEKFGVSAAVMAAPAAGHDATAGRFDKSFRPSGGCL